MEMMDKILPKLWTFNTHFRITKWSCSWQPETLPILQKIF